MSERGDEFDRIERDREANEGLRYEEWWDSRVRDDDEEEEDDTETGYAPDDPKHPDYYDNAVSVWDNREGK